MSLPNLDSLRRAAALIDAELPKLNTTTRVCECCGITVRDDIDEANAHRELTAARDKLMKWVDVLSQPAVEET